MSGYATRYLPLKFPHLAEPGEEIYVIIRNPRILPLEELQPREVDVDADGNPVDEADAIAATRELVAGIIVGWRVYSAAKVDGEQDQPLTLSADGEVDMPDQELLTWPPTPEKVAKLPIEIFTDIMEAVKEAGNPR